MQSISAELLPTSLQYLELVLGNGTKVASNFLYLNKLLVGVCSFCQ